MVTTIPIRFCFVDTETGAMHVGVMYGRGEDPADKGVYKAYTGGQKYILQKNLMVPTGDDPEMDLTEEGSNYRAQNSAGQPARPAPARAPAKQAPPAKPAPAQGGGQQSPARTPEPKQGGSKTKPAPKPAPAPEPEGETDEVHALREELQGLLDTIAEAAPALNKDEEKNVKGAMSVVDDADATEEFLEKVTTYIRWLVKAKKLG